MSNIECFHHLVKDKDFRDEFREYAKGLYKAGKHTEYGLPSQYSSFVRQLNRVKAFAEVSGKQSRSGRRMWSEGWEKLTKDFLDNSFTASARECLAELGLGQDKTVGMFSGQLLSWKEYEELKRMYGDKLELRGPFSDWADLRGYAGMLTSSAPVFYSVVCGRWLLVVGSSPDSARKD